MSKLTLVIGNKNYSSWSLRVWLTLKQNGDLLFGQFSIADAMFAPVVSRFITYDVKLGKVEQAYADAIWALPNIHEWVEAAALESEHLYRLPH
jgi:glutathione S-transferase